MAMVASAMADHIISAIDQLDTPEAANNAFYSALCEYVEANAQSIYSWAGVNPSGTPDPQVVLDCKIKTTGSISPSGASDTSSALAAFANILNAQASLWQVMWPAGFALSPAFVIPTIVFTPSMATDRKAALDHLCQEIINGLKACTPTAAGAHAAYTGTSTFTQLI